MSESGNYQLKNIFDDKFVKALANALKKQSKNFNHSSFLKQTLNSEWELKELKQRVTHLVQTLHKNLNEDFKKQSEILVTITPQFTGLKGIIFPEFISTYGLDHWSTSLNALKNLTEFSTSEFAIRHFIQKDSQKAIKERV